jgi:serine/threonine protein kinase
VALLVIWVLFSKKAPEVMSSKQHSYSVDYWALGVIIYELMMGKRPYAGINRKEYKERLLSNNVQLKECPWSDEAKDIINRLLQRKEEERLGHRDSSEVRSHPWFKSINWNDLENMRLTAPFVPNSVYIGNLDR